jgi:hypothetical protein
MSTVKKRSYRYSYSFMCSFTIFERVGSMWNVTARRLGSWLVSCFARSGSFYLLLMLDGVILLR